jgi:hypothetical protein
VIVVVIAIGDAASAQFGCAKNGAHTVLLVPADSKTWGHHPPKPDRNSSRHFLPAPALIQLKMNKPTGL